MEDYGRDGYLVALIVFIDPRGSKTSEHFGFIKLNQLVKFVFFHQFGKVSNENEILFQSKRMSVTLIVCHGFLQKWGTTKAENVQDVFF